MKVVVVASGELATGDGRHLDGAQLVLAADGGAAALDSLGRRPDAIIGDLDSAAPALVERLAAEGTRVERHPADKEASDTELAVRAALAAGATEIVVLGAIGGLRLDHELANVLLLADPALSGRDARIVRGAVSVRVVRGGERLVLDGRPGDLVTLLPVGGAVTGVSTEGLRWSLDAAALASGRSRGLSNEVVEAPASVRLKHGALLVVETRMRGAAQ